MQQCADSNFNGRFIALDGPSASPHFVEGSLDAESENPSRVSRSLLDRPNARPAAPSNQRRRCQSASNDRVFLDCRNSTPSQRVHENTTSALAIEVRFEVRKTVPTLGLSLAYPGRACDSHPHNVSLWHHASSRENHGGSKTLSIGSFGAGLCYG